MIRVELRQGGRVHLADFTRLRGWRTQCNQQIYRDQEVRHHEPVDCKQCLKRIAWHRKVEDWILAGEHPEDVPR